MKAYRLIHILHSGGDKETVIFLNADDPIAASDYLLTGDTIEFEGVIEADLPPVFPVGSELKS